MAAFRKANMPRALWGCAAPIYVCSARGLPVAKVNRFRMREDKRLKERHDMIVLESSTLPVSVRAGNVQVLKSSILPVPLRAGDVIVLNHPLQACSMHSIQEEEMRRVPRTARAVKTGDWGSSGQAQESTSNSADSTCSKK